MSLLLPPRDRRESEPAAPPSLARGPRPRTHAQDAQDARSACRPATAHGLHPAPARSRGPEGVVALPAAGHSVGHTAARARVGALHNDKGPLFQRGHRQVPAVDHGLQGGAVARPHGVLHVEDAVVPAPHLQGVASLSPGPPATLLPPPGWGLWDGGRGCLPEPGISLSHLGTLGAGQSRARGRSTWRTGD